MKNQNGKRATHSILRRKTKDFHSRVVFLGALVYGASLQATTFHLQSIAMMTDRSTLVVRAVPVAGSARSEWTADRATIITRTTFHVLEQLHAEEEVSKEIVVVTLGGRIESERISMQVDGSPQFRENEEVVVFLWRKPNETFYRMLDLAAGKFEIAKKDDIAVVTQRDLGGQIVVRGVSQSPETLADLRSQVAAASTAKRQRQRGGQ